MKSGADAGMGLRRSREDRSAWRPALLAGASVLGAVAAYAAYASYRRSSPALSTGPRRVALIGDSYAVGLGPLLAQRLPDFQYEGHVGTSTAQWAAHAPACGPCGDWIASYQPTVTLVSLGVNDGDGADPANYRTLVNGLRSVGSRVVWVEPPAAVRAPTALARRAIASLGVPTVPATTFPLSADGLHPRDYAGWASEIAHHVD